MEQQPYLKVTFRETIIGEFRPHLRVESKLLVELKAVSTLADHHRSQCVSYLKASGLHLCPLLNFGNPRLEIKRIANNL